MAGEVVVSRVPEWCCNYIPDLELGRVALGFGESTAIGHGQHRLERRTGQTRLVVHHKPIPVLHISASATSWEITKREMRTLTSLTNVTHVGAALSDYRVPQHLHVRIAHSSSKQHATLTAIANLKWTD